MFVHTEVVDRLIPMKQRVPLNRYCKQNGPEDAGSSAFEVHGQLGPEFRASESEYKPTTRLSTDLGTCSTHTDSYLCTDLYSLCTYLWYACIYALTETSSQASDLFRTDSLTGMKSDKPRTC